MSSDNYTIEYSPFEIVKGNEPLYDVVEVKSLDNYELAVKFEDSTSGIVKMKERILGENPGVFIKLANKKVFDQAYVYLGVVTWPNGMDLAPDAMYFAFKKYGVWELK